MPHGQKYFRHQANLRFVREQVRLEERQVQFTVGSVDIERVADDRYVSDNSARNSAEKCSASVDEASHQVLHGTGRRDRSKTVATIQDPQLLSRHERER